MRSDRWAIGGMLTVVVSLVVGGMSAIMDDRSGPALWMILGMGAMGVWAAARSSTLTVLFSALLAALEVLDPSPWGTWAVAGGLLFLFALRRPRFDAVTAGVLVAASSVLATYGPSVSAGSVGAFGLVALATAMVGVGQWVQAQRRYVIAEVGRRRKEAEHRREEVARHVAEERVRIARELHDSVAHHLAVVSVHVNVARINATRAPQAAERALADVQSATQSVMEELGVILSVLRTSQADVIPSPPVDAAMIDDLLLSFEGIGLRIETDGLEHLLALAPVARTAAQRLLQEALTNVHRHGDGNAAVVVQAPVDGYVTVSIRNGWKPRETSSAGSGLGLVGMEERVHLLGGTFHAGLDADGFLVTAQLPAAAPRNRKATPA